MSSFKDIKRQLKIDSQPHSTHHHNATLSSFQPKCSCNLHFPSCHYYEAHKKGAMFSAPTSSTYKEPIGHKSGVQVFGYTITMKDNKKIGILQSDPNITDLWTAEGKLIKDDRISPDDYRYSITEKFFIENDQLTDEEIAKREEKLKKRLDELENKLRKK